MKVIGVTGGKGGTGKSTIATALAYELAKKNVANEDDGFPRKIDIGELIAKINERNE